MSDRHASAVDAALAYLRDPLVHAVPPLPEDVGPLLRIAAAEPGEIERAARATGEAPARLREAASLFLQCALFVDEDDSYRTLGVRPDASHARLREHHRWLVRWLHPDRNPDSWEATYLYRVNRAWQDLRTEERRRAFDARRRPHLVRAAPARAVRMRVVATEGRHVRATSPPLPRIAFGVVATVAGGTLAWLNATQDIQDDYTRAVVGASPASTAADVRDALAGDAAEPRDAAAEAALPVARTMPAHLPPTPEGAPTASVRQAPLPSLRALPPRRTEARTEASTPASASGDIVPLPQRRALRGAAATEAQVARPKIVHSRTAPVLRPPAPLQAAAIARPRQVRMDVPIAPIPPPIDEAEARALVARFARAYESGDLDALAGVLTRVDAGSRERRDMLHRYRKLFLATHQRRFDLSRLSVLGSGGTGAVIANYSTSTLGTGGRPSEQRGDIRFDLLREDGVLRVHQVRHDPH